MKRRISKFNDKTTGLLNFADLKQLKFKLLYWFFFLILLVVVLTCLVPVLWAFMSGFKSTQEMYSIPPTFIPSHFDFGKIPDVISRTNIGKSFFSTIILIAGAMVFEIFSNGLLGYALAKLRPKGYKVVNVIIFWSMLLPGISMLPLYMFYVDVPVIHISLLGTYWPMWFACGCQAFTVLLFRNFFNGIPTSYLEAARIDGCGELKIFTKIIIPLSKPIIACVAIQTVTAQWKDFMWPYLILSGTGMETVSVKLYQLNLDSYLADNEFMIVTMCAIIPPFIMYCLFANQIMGGLNMSGIKG